MESVVISSAWLEKRGWKAVRDVYKRACIVHCPRKAVIRMKWASFEENIGNTDAARDILRQLVAKYPMLLEARMQQIDLERRDKKFEVAEKMYLKLMKQIPSKHEKYKNMKTWIAMKYARFQFKICANPDKALSALRSALKKERGNPIRRLLSEAPGGCERCDCFHRAGPGQQGAHQHTEARVRQEEGRVHAGVRGCRQVSRRNCYLFYIYLNWQFFTL